MHTPAAAGAADELITGGARSLDALKHEVQRRADRGMPPLGGIRPEDARAALAQIDSLSREQWALAWSSIAERHFAQAQSSGADAREHYWHAWRLHHFARWPVENTPAKQHARQRALDAFRNYARLLDPPMEVVRIPSAAACAGAWCMADRSTVIFSRTGCRSHSHQMSTCTITFRPRPRCSAQAAWKTCWFAPGNSRCSTPACWISLQRPCCWSTARAIRRSRLPTCLCCSNMATPRKRGSIRQAATWGARPNGRRTRFLKR